MSCSCHPNERRRHVPRGLLELMSTVAVAGIIVQRIELLEQEHSDEGEPLEPVDEGELGGEG